MATYPAHGSNATSADHLRVRLRIEATDAATASLVEAAVDDVRVTRG